MVTFKTFAKIVAVAVGTIAAIAVADEVIDKICESKISETDKTEADTEIANDVSTAKAIVNCFIALIAMSKIAIKFYARGLQSGVIYGAVAAAKNGATMDDVRYTILDDDAFGRLMGEIGGAVRV